MICNNCNSKNIKTRKNFSHGKFSKAKKSVVCGDCGSSNIEIPRPTTRFNKRR